jgi:hypothetical protein
MSEAKRIGIGVLGGVLGIVVLFTLVLMLVGKGDESTVRPQGIASLSPSSQKADIEPLVDPSKSAIELEAVKRADELRVRKDILARLQVKQAPPLVERSGFNQASPSLAEQPLTESEKLASPPSNTTSTKENGQDQKTARLSEIRADAKSSDEGNTNTSADSVDRSDSITRYTPPRRKRYRQSSGQTRLDGINIYGDQGVPTNQSAKINERANPTMRMGGVRHPSIGGHYCGAMTLKGTSCARWVVNGLYCWQHGG